MRAMLMGLTLLSVSACGPEEKPVPPPPPAGQNAAMAYVCAGRMEWPDGTGVQASHVAWIFPDESVMTTCATEGASDMASLTMMYRSKDPGARTAVCVMTFDVDGYATGGGFQFVLSTDRKYSTVTYKDVDTAGGQRILRMPCEQR